MLGRYYTSRGLETLVDAAVAVFRIVESSSAVKGDDDDDGLFRALDKELEDFLEDAIDDLPQRLDNDLALQKIEGSGELPLELIATTEITVKASLHNVRSSLNEAASVGRAAGVDTVEERALNASDAAVLLQMLSSMAMTALPKEPGVRELAQRVINEAVNEEVMELLSNGTTSTTPPLATTSTVHPSPSSPRAALASPLKPRAADIPSAASPTVQSAPIEVHMKTEDLPMVNATDPLKDERSVCLQDAVCYGDDECGEGQCHGVSLGRCNCHACVTNMACTDDAHCGGLLYSCQYGSCRCAEALARHGFPLFVVALTNFCSQRTCTVESNSCFGLPCNHGTCSCPQ